MLFRLKMHEKLVGDQPPFGPARGSVFYLQHPLSERGGRMGEGMEKGEQEAWPGLPPKVVAYAIQREERQRGEEKRTRFRSTSFHVLSGDEFLVL